ncbi:hypothetical protein ABZ595_28735 [Streptomyces rubradiris]|uniref:hypothetical protein n=1 Tax=Streptomyces rubradiris TaxID=285531 RepID=UPI0033CF7DE9
MDAIDGVVPRIHPVHFSKQTGAKKAAGRRPRSAWSPARQCTTPGAGADWPETGDDAEPDRRDRDGPEPGMLKASLGESALLCAGGPWSARSRLISIGEPS